MFLRRLRRRPLALAGAFLFALTGASDALGLEACAHPMAAHAAEAPAADGPDCHRDEAHAGHENGHEHGHAHGHGDHHGHGTHEPAPHAEASHDDHGHDDHGCTCGFHCVGAAGAVRDAAPATLSLPAPPPPPATPFPASAREHAPSPCSIPHLLPFAQAPPLHA